MSTATVTLNTANQLNINRDTAKIFLGEDNRFESETYTNNTGAQVTLVVGMVMGRVSATGLLLPLVAAAVDDSNIPVGVLTEEHVVANGASVTVSICVAGDVAKEQLVFNGAETFTTVVSGRQLGDRIAGDTMGIKLVTTTDLTGFDN